MEQPEELQTRFNDVMSRLEAIRSQVNVSAEDGTVVVDTGDLDTKCRRYRDQINRLVQLPEVPELDDALGTLLIDLRVSIDDMMMCCSGLTAPLDRLISAIYDQLPDDPEYTDDAS